MTGDNTSIFSQSDNTITWRYAIAGQNKWEAE